ncbi:hypothetical protein [Mediterraneibacter agrestimuris]|uniref:hypothetical protein n=1 Tax=Mediterraneibacter agrestimuris TaxID=2941333 RepID=UPI0020406EBD|nr:hypothetical protein [Mediterraneibacter agrestimuris]
MSRIKDCIDNGLSDMKLVPDFLERADYYQRTNKSSYHMTHRVRYSAVAAILSVVLFGTVAFAAGSLLYSKIKVNQKTIPDLEALEVVAVKEVDGDVTEYGDVKKEYTSVWEAETDLGIQLLDTDFAADNEYTKVFYSKIGDGYHVLDVQECIMGDLSNIREWKESAIDNTMEGNDEWYAWTQGNIYKSPIDLKVEIISDPAQQELDTEYMGYFKYVETFVSEQGYTVNVLQDTVEDDDLEAMSEIYVPQTQMVFVANGIRYTLKGRVSSDTMKEVVNSMK